MFGINLGELIGRLTQPGNPHNFDISSDKTYSGRKGQTNMTPILDPRTDSEIRTDDKIWNIVNDTAGKRTGSTGGKQDNPNITDISTSGIYGGGGGGSQYTDTTAARAAEQARIDALLTKEANLLSSNQNQYNNVLAGYDRERNINQTDYNDNTVTNSQDLQRNKQASLLAGAQGLRGLMNTLGAYGAAGGSGRDLASQAVNSQINRETGDAANTYAVNQRGLDTSINRFKEEDEARRLAAQQDLETSNRATRANIASERQTALKSLADLWKQAGNQGQAGNLLGEVGQLNHFIAGNAAPSIGINARTAAYQAPSLDTYKAGTSSQEVGVADGATAGNTGALANLYKRREEEDR